MKVHTSLPLESTAAHCTSAHKSFSSSSSSFFFLNAYYEVFTIWKPFPFSSSVLFFFVYSLLFFFAFVRRFFRLV